MANFFYFTHIKFFSASVRNMNCKQCTYPYPYPIPNTRTHSFVKQNLVAILPTWKCLLTQFFKRCMMLSVIQACATVIVPRVLMMCQSGGNFEFFNVCERERFPPMYFCAQVCCWLTITVSQQSHIIMAHLTVGDITAYMHDELL